MRGPPAAHFAHSCWGQRRSAPMRAGSSAAATVCWRSLRRAAPREHANAWWSWCLHVCQVSDQVGGPKQLTLSEPGFDEPVGAVFREHTINHRVIGLGRRGAEGERDRTESELEQAI